MSTVHPKVEKPSREQLLAEQLKKEHVRLKDIDKMEQKELEAGSFLASYTRGKYEFSKEGECTCKKIYDQFICSYVNISLSANTPFYIMCQSLRCYWQVHPYEAGFKRQNISVKG